MLDAITVPVEIQEELNEIGESEASPSTPIDTAKRKAEAYNEMVGHLEGYDCPKCKNRGNVMRWDERGNTYVVECSCMTQRESAHRIRKSGLGNLLDRYTMETWQEPETWQKKMRQSAEEYADNRNGWFYVAGRPGTGKTHLCTALCSLIMERGIEVRYLLWRDFSVKAKALVTDAAEYARMLNPYRYTPVLYIDDLFKTRNNAMPTDGDVNLAFELLNDRYNDKRLITIISSELTADDLLAVDEGLGSRIYERSKNNYYDLSQKGNWRLRDGH